MSLSDNNDFKESDENSFSVSEKPTNSGSSSGGSKTTTNPTCIPILTNTSWSNWTNVSDCVNNTINQSRNLTEHDSAGCVSNKTFFDNRSINCITDHFCGDNECNSDETCLDCEEDCKKCSEDTIINSKSGIDVLFQGISGEDYAQEYYWHDPWQDDNRVVYIKEDTLIVLQHNERNEMQIGNGNHIVIGKDGGGDIRYVIDRDWQRRYLWAQRGDSPLYPAYTGPFSFSELDYGTGYSDDSSNVPIVGSVGDNNEGITIDKGIIHVTDRKAHYQYGQLDEFGDEWHQMVVANDDHNIRTERSYHFSENDASDSKLMHFVVNPKTPLIRFEATNSDAQFYTTPAKIYQVPKIHRQISYVSEGIKIELVNIMNDNPVYYKWDGEINYTLYSDKISIENLDDGEHILHYYYRDDVIKNRTIIKNPEYPSASETHGYLLWENETEFEKVKYKVSEDETTPNYYQYKGKGGASLLMRTDYPDCFNTEHESCPESPYGGKGLRTKFTKVLHNAFVGVVEGLDDSELGLPSANRSKAMLLDNAINIADIGVIIGNGDPNPAIVLWRRGYYDVNHYFDLLFAYDLLIKDYKSTNNYEGGITPIEDYKIRDSLASVTNTGLMTQGDYAAYGEINSASGMGGTSREIAGYLIALGLPSYDTNYYGTSGFDGSVAKHNFTPYPNQAVTWKQMFFDEDYPDDSEFPNWAHPFGLHEQFIAEPTSREANPNYGGYIENIPPGTFTDRIGYAKFDSMGHVFQVFANVIKISPYTSSKNYPSMNEHFRLASPDSDGQPQLYGMKVMGSADILPKSVEQVMLINKRFPDISGNAAQYIADNLDSSLAASGVLGVILYDPYLDEGDFSGSSIEEDHSFFRTTANNIGKFFTAVVDSIFGVFTRDEEDVIEDTSNKNTKQEIIDEKEDKKINETLVEEEINTEKNINDNLIQNETIAENETNTSAEMSVENETNIINELPEVNESVSPDLIIPKDYQGYWKLNGNTNDEKGLNNGVLFGGKFVEGINGQAVYFDGIDDYLDLGISKFEMDETNELSILIWIKILENNPNFDSDIIILRGQYISPFLIKYYKNGKLQTAIKWLDEVYRYSESSLNKGEWYHIGLTYKEGQRRIYINGKIDSETTSFGNITANDNRNTYIGGMPGNESYGNLNMIADEVLIYNRALKEEEISKIYNSQKPN